MLAVVEAAQMIVFPPEPAALVAVVMVAHQMTLLVPVEEPILAAAVAAVEPRALTKTGVLAVRVLSNLDTPTPKQFQILAAG
jgi:hypothetical protein